MATQKKPILIDKDYKPIVGDVLSNDMHPFVIVQAVYSLDKISVRVNKKFYEQEARYNVLQKIIYRKEVIWQQHKLDLSLYPDNTGSNPNRANWNYNRYLAYNDVNKLYRLYNSKYSLYPARKIKVVIGKKIMVKANHALCISHRDDGRMLPCGYWYGGYSMPLTKLINNDYLYHGNLYTNFMNIDLKAANIIGK